MRNTAALDRRQRALCKLLYTAGTRGQASLDVIQQNENFAGITAAMRNAMVVSEQDTDKALVLAGCAAKCATPYNALRCIAQRTQAQAIGYGYEEMVTRVLRHVRDNLNRHDVCLAIDHAGYMRPARLETVFRCADQAAFHLNMSCRVVLILDKVDKRDCHGQRYAEMPHGSVLLHPRQRTWDWSSHGFKLTKMAGTVRLFNEDDAQQEETSELRAVKSA